jgi:ABC-type sulfate/molybdate transport systems ATPase subunit
VLDAHIVKARSAFTIDVALRVERGASCGLFGASGAGKSTILACIAGAETPDGGTIELDGRRLYPPSAPLHERALGYLTQDANLFPHLRVGENVCFGLPAPERRVRSPWIDELVERLDLGALWNASVRAISGGQARRVALARMLAPKPPLVLLDEPFTGLDRHLVRALLAAIGGWQRELGFTLVVVDHDADILARLAPRVLAIENGRTIQDGRWDELRMRPATPLLERLLAPL